jgi:hypothetical protein
MRNAGFDPSQVVDAPLRIGVVEGTVTLQDMKGAIIGDQENCSGSRCLRRKLRAILAGKNIVGDLFLAMSASRAIIAWRQPSGKQTAYRFIVNGLPDKQDRTMNVVGEVVKLRPPTTYMRARTGRQQGSKKNQRRKPVRGTVTGRNSTAVQSLAAQLRSA